MKLNDVQKALLKGAIKAIYLDMNYGDIPSYFDDPNPTNYEPEEDWEIASMEERNGTKVISVLEEILKESEDPIVYSCNYYKSNVVEVIADRDEFRDEEDPYEKAKAFVTEQFMDRLNYELSKADGYPEWEEFCIAVNLVYDTMYGNK